MVEEILFAARRAAEFRKKGRTAHYLESDRAFLIHGARGIGKTFLYNFVLSEFDSRFDDPNDHSIWVRLNLVDPPYDVDQQTSGVDQLKNWIYGQITKIILRYYDLGSARYRQGKKSFFPMSPYEALSAHFKEISAESTPVLESTILKLDRIRTVFLQEGRDDVLHETLVPPEYGAFLFEYALDSGYSIVIVFDGLDVLESTQHWKGRFNRVFSAIRTLCTSDDLLGVAFVVIMRTNTLHSEKHPYSTRPAKIYEVGAPTLEKILGQRIELLKAEVLDLSRLRYHDWVLDPLFDRWPGHLTEFLAFIYPTTPEPEGRFLEAVMGDDRRSQMEAVKLRYLEFLEIKHATPYRLVETLMKAGMQYPPLHYIYAIEGKKLRRNAADPIRGSSRFFPSLFRVPYCPGHTELSADSVLAGIRVLQIFDAHQKGRENSIGPLKIENAAYIAETLFGCPSRIAINLIEEYIEYQVFKSYARFGFRSDLEGQEDVYLTTKGKYLLGAIRDVAYLNMAAMRALLNPPAFNREAPFIRAAYLDRRSRRGLEEWVLAKLLNAISIYRLIAEVNERQRANMHNRIEKLQRKERPLYVTVGSEIKKGYIFDNIDQASDNIIKEIGAVIGSLLNFDPRPELTVLREGLSCYIEAWC